MLHYVTKHQFKIFTSVFGFFVLPVLRFVCLIELLCYSTRLKLEMQTETFLNRYLAKSSSPPKISASGRSKPSYGKRHVENKKYCSSAYYQYFTLDISFSTDAACILLDRIFLLSTIAAWPK